jgi:hypothetical protein
MRNGCLQDQAREEIHRRPLDERQQKAGIDLAVFARHGIGFKKKRSGG